ncbi:14212_t:CDS:2 [Funneliformis geosporum]|uniref:7175_t:CDS:1 n=1 Tax=Funneliformis geosporum TaxID=1117311 RepID=A0A9W4WQU9_9GLOM|nr:14212_t:CDS:2 [Funneliformis geosporum]CAI2172122.1 7175_t:CDS:2 [Funneliformis geosporum]
MKKRILILLLLIALIFIQVGVHGSSEKCVNHGFCIKITPTGNLLSFELEAPTTMGWVAIGLGNSMVGSYIVMAWPSSNGSAIISQRKAEEYGVPYPTEQQNDLSLDAAASGLKDGKFIAKFTRPISVTGSKIEVAEQSIIWAVQTDDRPPDDPQTYEITIHNAKGSYIFKSSGETIISNYEKYIIAHGATMFFVWGIVVPGAIFIARFTRNIIPQKWFRLHWGIQQFVASPLILIGIILAITAGVRFNASNSHHLLGLAVFFGFIFQISLGWIHHKLYDSARKYYPWWTKLHWWWGRILTLLAFIQIPLGFQQYNASHEIFMGYYAYVTLILASFAGLSYYLYKKRINDIKAFNKSDVLYTGIRQDDVEQQS